MGKKKRDDDQNMTRWGCFFIGVYIIVFWLTRRSWVREVPFHQDEPDYVGNSFLWREFERGNFSRDVWDKQWSIDQPHLYHFVTGWYLGARWGDGWSDKLDRLGFMDRSGDIGGGPTVNWGMLGDGQVIGDGPLGDKDGVYKLMVDVRNLSLWFWMVSVVVLLVLVWDVGGWRMVVLAAVWMLFDKSEVMMWMVRASADSLLIGLVMVFLYCWRSFLKGGGWWWGLGMMVVTGLAMATKLNGFVLLLGLIASVFVHFRGMAGLKPSDKFDLFGGGIVLSVLVSGLIFYCLTPYLYVDSLRNFLDMFVYRLDVIKGQAMDGVNTVVSGNLMARYFFLSGQSLKLLDGTEWLSTLVVTLSLVWGSWIVVRMGHFGTWVKVWLVALILWVGFIVTIPIAWARYYLPLRFLSLVLLSIVGRKVGRRRVG